jgi:hypothetical protein
VKKKMMRILVMNKINKIKGLSWRKRGEKKVNNFMTSKINL